MSIDNSWLVNVSVSINTQSTQLPAFNSCALVGVFDVSPSSWGSSIFKSYSSASDFNVDFDPMIFSANASLNLLTVSRLNWLKTAVSKFFSQTPAPNPLTIFKQTSPISTTSYTTLFNSYISTNNNFYSFSLCDLLLPNTFSIAKANIEIAANQTVTLTKGTTLTVNTSPTAPYVLQSDVTVKAGATSTTFIVPFYSTDATTGAATATAISPTVANVVSVSLNGIPSLNMSGYNTVTNGVVPALAALRAAYNQKKLFSDFNDSTFAGAIQTAGGSKDQTCFYHSSNLKLASLLFDTTSSLYLSSDSSASLSSACMSKYFTQVFQNQNGLTVLSSMKIDGVVTDSAVTTANIGDPSQDGGSSNLIGWNNNVYPGFGSGIGLVQYGFQSSNKKDAHVYLDQVVGSDYLQFVAQARLVDMITNSLPSGIPYSDVGIQQIVNNFKGSIDSAVSQRILQPYKNSDIVYFNYATVESTNPTDIANRIYKNISFNGKFLSRIQRLSVSISLTL